jgi:hypothetical protein
MRPDCRLSVVGCQWLIVSVVKQVIESSGRISCFAGLTDCGIFATDNGQQSTDTE